jgi:hypothetical protein
VFSGRGSMAHAVKLWRLRSMAHGPAPRTVGHQGAFGEKRRIFESLERRCGLDAHQLAKGEPNRCVVLRKRELRERERKLERGPLWRPEKCGVERAARTSMYTAYRSSLSTERPPSRHSSTRAVDASAPRPQVDLRPPRALTFPRPHSTWEFEITPT